MRLVLCTDTFNDVNGVCRFIRHVARHHHAKGRDFTVITSTRIPPPPGEPGGTNVVNLAPLWARPMPGYPQLDAVLPPFFTIIRTLKALRPDVIHLSTPGPVGWAGWFAARQIGCPVVGVYHTDFPAYIDKLFTDEGLTVLTAATMRTFYHRFATVLCRSDEYRAALAKLGVSPDGVRTLLPGVDTHAFAPRFRNPRLWARLGLRKDSIKILNVGRVSVEKNLPFLVQVWKEVRQRLHARQVDVELVVIGDGPYRAAMQRELQGCDVHFLGFRFGEELATLYGSSDLFVFPSLTDTLGQVAMESQASGLPVLVSDQGGPQHVVRHGITGLILPRSDHRAWVNAIEDLCIDADARRAMGVAAHRAMQPLSIEHSLEDFWRVHEDAICNRTQGPQGT